MRSIFESDVILQTSKYIGQEEVSIYAEFDYKPTSKMYR